MAETAPRFNRGDRVTIRRDLKLDTDYCNTTGNHSTGRATRLQVDNAGLTVEISQADNAGYNVYGVGGYFVDSMFEGINDSPPAETKPEKPFKLPKKITEFTILGQDRAKKNIKVAVAKNMPVLLVGETGTGKTTLVKDLATTSNKKWLRLNLTGETTVDEFVGKYTLADGATQWQDGVLLQAMRAGLWLIVDEINVALPEILFVLHSLLDDDKSVLVANHDGEVVKPHADFRFFATMNPVEEYAGTKDLNKAFKSRFGMILNLEYPIPRVERAVVELKTGLDSEQASKLVDLAVSLRKAKADSEIFYTCSTRDLIQLGSLIEPLGFSEALRVSIVNKANGDGKIVSRIVKQVIADYKEAETLTGSTNLELIQAKISEFKQAEQSIEAGKQQLEAGQRKLDEREAQLIERLEAKKASLKAEAKRELIAELTQARAAA